MLDILGRQPVGVPLADIVEKMMGKEFESSLDDLTGEKSPSPRSLLERLGVSCVPDESCRAGAWRRFRLNAAVNEMRAREREPTGPGGSVGSAVVILGLLYAKWRGSVELAFQTVARIGGLELTAPTSLKSLDSWLAPELIWRSALSQLLVQLIQHHDRVIYEKGRLESCWVHPEGDYLVRDQDYEPGLRTLRRAQSSCVH